MSTIAARRLAALARCATARLDEAPEVGRQPEIDDALALLAIVERDLEALADDLDSTD